MLARWFPHHTWFLGRVEKKEEEGRLVCIRSILKTFE